MFGFFQFSSVAQSCPTRCDPINCSTPGFPVHHQLPEFTSTESSIESVMPSSLLILGHLLLLLPPIPPSIKVFSNESTLRMRWPKYWSFSFSMLLTISKMQQQVFWDFWQGLVTQWWLRTEICSYEIEGRRYIMHTIPQQYNKYHLLSSWTNPSV